MKNISKSIIAVLLIFSGINMSAQNTFPSTGNVGIGITNPQQKLHIHSINPPAFTLLSGTAPGVLFSKIAFPTNNLALAAIGLSTNSNGYHSGSITGDFNIRGGAGRDILIGTLASSNSTNGTERIRIKNNGKVGIGVIDPQAKLDVKGSIKNDSFDFKNNSGDLRMRRFGAGDITWKRAMVPIYNANTNKSTLMVNFVGDFEEGVRIAGSKLNVDGQVGIGTTDTSGYRLAVRGNILAEELKIRTYANWPDYVFETNYELKSLTEIDTYIKENGHLPNIPSAKKVTEEGFNVGEMNAKLLEKVEELTLYIIKLNQELKEVKKELKIKFDPSSK
ncbi:hypothetical protein [uncultured Aquimarina sp.]|uniref:hypothetical protein n=1 Tax=uncultured Aquimarina sp. TaxID=575652 RepID=UPI00262B5BEF|nr:hypothetical protein [uncultured Aquimarina sp.]